MTIAATAKIRPWAKIIDEGGRLSVGEHSRIDDFTFVNAGKMCTIGRLVHIASFVSIAGGGEFAIDDFSGLGAGCRVITGTDDYLGPFMTNPTVPREFTNYEISHVRIEKHVIVGANAVIFPGVTIGEGAAVEPGSMVRRDLPPWGIYSGEPLRKIGERDRDAVRERARLLVEKLSIS
jgi:acetyltransferase-like isoleucine patch superfamily enzyme